jgi:hypothetical protein
MGTMSNICLPALIACLGACTDYTPEKVADPTSITVADAYTSIGDGFLALQKEMNGAKMGLITCKVDIKFAIAAQAGQKNDLQAAVSGGPQYVQAKLSNDYTTSAAGNRSNTVEVVLGSIYPTICQPVDTGGGAANANNNNNNNNRNNSNNNSNPGGAVNANNDNNPGGAANGNRSRTNNASGKRGSKNGKIPDDNAASALSAQTQSPRVTTVMARYTGGMPIGKNPAIELTQGPAPTNSPCKSDEIEAHDTQGKIICIKSRYIMQAPEFKDELRAILKTPEMKNEIQGLFK